MFNLAISAARKSYFDAPLVMRAMDRAERKVLSQFGAFMRRRAKGLIRTRKKTSEPGSPPSSHTGILKRFILFAYERNRQSVIVGPAKTNQVFFDNDRKPVRGTVPQILEIGGLITVLEVQKNGKWQRADLRQRRRNAGLPTRFRTAKIEARPYMQPALDIEGPKFPRLWKNSIAA